VKLSRYFPPITLVYNEFSAIFYKYKSCKSHAFINIVANVENVANVVNNSKCSMPRRTSYDSALSQLSNFDILLIIRNLLQSTKMIHQQSITSRRNGETTSRSPLCSINLYWNMADMSQVTSSSSSPFENRLRLQVELAAAEFIDTGKRRKGADHSKQNL
jgi:hypothetical protein